jgi:hypothetical protein
VTGRWIVLAIVVAQGCPPATRSVLSAGHLANLQAESLAPVVHVSGLPIIVREALRSLFGESVLQLADPQAPSPPYMFPWTRDRRLILAGCGPDHCLVHFEHREYGRSLHIVVFGLNKGDAQVEWSGLVPQPVNGLPELKAVVQRMASETR